MEPALVLHSSPGRLALAWSAPLMLLALGGGALLEGGPTPLPVVLAVVGAALLGVVLFDLPLRTEFDEEGFTRVCPLRRERIEWRRVVAIERVVSGGRQRRALKKSKQDDPTARAPDRSQGLTARLGPRRVTLLVDRLESHAEHTEVRRLLREQVTVVRAAPPPLDAPPAGRGASALHRRI